MKLTIYKTIYSKLTLIPPVKPIETMTFDTAEELNEYIRFRYYILVEVSKYRISNVRLHVTKENCDKFFNKYAK